ncbi:uncharacterized protein BO87DRAFT_409747 [Aspergillus neoniger CBS 115656]|uniref:Uncharacterized protein n=1 Tax=Aspergillus neoniger (strain CBS 115656) TaxID=1448310 RepID=A0A318Y7V5_ASPNB|nr:hypothetical protein BO87DRAFT_409747 [Aspergillus neoniger CBS 115656]PYH30366.1 hypothetical protein BO87DRAFT_409747 [Aspergillus neoniger CBS 115656]
MVAVDYLHERCGLIHSLSPKKAISFAWLCIHYPSSSIKSSELDNNLCLPNRKHSHLLDRGNRVNCMSQARILSDVGKSWEPGRKSIGANASVRWPGFNRTAERVGLLGHGRAMTY